MEYLTENDYRELVDYMIRELKDREAYDITRQIQDLIKAGAADQDTVSKAQRNRMYTDPQLFNETIEFVLPDGPNAPGSTLYRDVFYSAIDILEAYLLTAPKMIGLTAERLGLAPFRDIIWATEAVSNGEESFLPAMEAVSKLCGELEKLVAELKPNL